MVAKVNIFNEKEEHFLLLIIKNPRRFLAGI